MSWQVGDLAVCVNKDGWLAARSSGATEPHEGPERGWVGMVTGFSSLGAITLLVFAEWHPAGLSADQFRKVDKPEACEDEFVTLLKRTKVQA